MNGKDNPVFMRAFNIEFITGMLSGAGDVVFAGCRSGVINMYDMRMPVSETLIYSLIGHRRGDSVVKVHLQRGGVQVTCAHGINAKRCKCK